MHSKPVALIITWAAHVFEDDARDGVLPLHRRLQQPEQLPHQRRALQPNTE